MTESAPTLGSAILRHEGTDWALHLSFRLDLYKRYGLAATFSSGDSLERAAQVLEDAAAELRRMQARFSAG